MKTTSTKVNYIYSIIYQILASILPLVTSPYIARTIGADGIGIYSYSYSIAHYFAIFILLGLANYGNRTIASVRNNKDEMSKSFWEIYFMQLSLSVIFIGAYIGYLFFFEHDNFLISSLMTIYLFSAAFDINWFFNGIELFKYTVIRNTVIKLLTVACIFIFVKSSDDIWIYTLIMVGGFLFSQLALWPYLKKYIYFHLPKVKDVFKHLKPNLVLFIPVIAINMYKYMDKIMLGMMINKTQVGFYENAEKVILIPMGFITAFGNVMLPKMSNLYANGKNDNAKSYMGLSFHFITILTLAMAFGLASVSTKFSIIFWGQPFSVCGQIIAVLSISMIFISWPNVIRTQYLIPTHNEKHYIISVIIGAIVNVVVNLIFIKRMQAVGTAIGTVFAEFSVCVYQLWAVRKNFNVKKIIKNNIVFIVPGIVMYFVVHTISVKTRVNIIMLVAEIVIGVIIYMSLLIILELVFNKEKTINIIKSAINKLPRKAK